MPHIKPISAGAAGILTCYMIIMAVKTTQGVGAFLRRTWSMVSNKLEPIWDKQTLAEQAELGRLGISETANKNSVALR